MFIQHWVQHLCPVRKPTLEECRFSHASLLLHLIVSPVSSVSYVMPLRDIRNKPHVLMQNSIRALHFRMFFSPSWSYIIYGIWEMLDVIITTRGSCHASYKRPMLPVEWRSTIQTFIIYLFTSLRDHVYNIFIEYEIGEIWSKTCHKQPTQAVAVAVEELVCSVLSAGL